MATLTARLSAQASMSRSAKTAGCFQNVAGKKAELILYPQAGLASMSGPYVMEMLD